MLIDVTLPLLGESVSEGTISKWLVREGDVVTKDQPLVEIATDKADSELPAPYAGRVAKILAAEGATVPVKSVLCQIEEGVGAGEATKKAERKSAAPPAAPAPAAPDDEALRASRSGRQGLRREKDLLSPGERKARRESTEGATNGESTAEAAHAQPVQPEPAPRPAPQPAQRPAPQAANLANLINQGGGFVPPVPGLGYGSFKVPAYRPTEGDQVVPFTRRRRITADHMTYSKVTAPHVVTVAEVDLHKTSKLRDAHKDRYKKEGHALTMLAFVVVAAARGLRENPGLNARVLDDAYVILKDINLGVAVDSPDGLVVPVIRRADELGVRGIVRAVDDVAKRARGGKITIDDLSGASFSVTNPGIKGNLFGGAIINQPNVGILRMGEIQKRVVVVESPEGEDQMAIHPVMYMALSYDHRVVDGVAANSFLWRVTELLEKGDFEV